MVMLYDGAPYIMDLFFRHFSHCKCVFILHLLHVKQILTIHFNDSFIFSFTALATDFNFKSP